MSQSPNKYQAIILQDVRSKEYDSHKKSVWIGFFGIWGLSLAYYTFFLVKRFQTLNFSFSQLIQAYVRDPRDSSLTTLYVHETGVLFLGLAMALVIFAILGFFIFDLQQRNEVIRQQLAEHD